VLAPYGSWVQVSSYGEVWRPHVSAGFVPYINGHWVYTSYGPTWVGYEPWAWAPYHYGQWVNAAGYGWVWVPGYEWSPARVAWATGPEYIGWSPVLSGNPDVNFWVVVNRARFVYSNYSRYVLPPVTVRSMFDRRVVRVHSGPPQRVELERILRRPVRVVRVDERRVSVEGHSARLILPRGHEGTALRQISRVSHRTSAVEKSKKITLKEKVAVKKKPERHAVSMKSSLKAAKRKPEKQVSMKSSSKVQASHRVEQAKIHAKTRTEVASKSHASTKVASFKSKEKVATMHKEKKISQHSSKQHLKVNSQHHKATQKSKRKPDQHSKKF
jgi:hypothetical protein